MKFKAVVVAVCGLLLTVLMLAPVAIAAPATQSVPSARSGVISAPQPTSRASQSGRSQAGLDAVSNQVNQRVSPKGKPSNPLPKLPFDIKINRGEFHFRIKKPLD